MRIVMATHGTTGDVQPLLALARALEQRGHTAVLAAPPNYRTRAAQVGVAFRALGPDVSHDRFNAAFAPLAGVSDLAEQVRSTVGMLEDSGEQMFEELLDECRTADLLISFPYQFAGTMVRDKTRMRFASIHFHPFGTGNKRLAAASGPIVNRVRERVGLPPLADPLGVDAYSDRLVLFPVSEHVFRRPVKWPAHFHLTGYAFFEEPFEPSGELREFLAAGPPPVVFTFGSVVHEDPQRVSATLLEAVARVGCRAIIQRGWSGLSAAAAPANVLLLGDTPHTWLFPRASCVVHACGAGTTAAALRGGVPTLPVPHWLDQPLWARMVKDLGCAATVLPFPAMTADALTEALTKTLGSQAVAEKSAAMGRKLRDERGLDRLVELVLSAAA
jgi:sterol 3beta-glucosyltransferase